MKAVYILRYINYILLGALFFSVVGCSESPKAKYIRLCLEVSTTDVQRDSCKCMAKEFDKILTRKEFEVTNIAMERTVKVIKEIGGVLSQTQIPGYLDDSGIDKQVLISGMQKMQPLHNAHVCGYGTQ